MLSLIASGYVTGEVKVEDTEYGRRGTISIRSKTTNGKQRHYVNGSIYGKKIETAAKFMEDGRQVSLIGSVKNIVPKKNKDGSDYVAIYMDVTDFTIPENRGGEPMTAPTPSPSDMAF